MNPIVHDDNESSPSTEPHLIGQGNFGKVYHYPLQPYVFKTVKHADSAGQLQLEFDNYCAAHTVIGYNNDEGDFSVPKAWEISNSLKDFPNPTILMDLIPPLHPTIGSTYQNLFWDESIRDSTYHIRLLRLYLGKEDLPPITKSLPAVVAADPPLNITRYNALVKEMSSSGFTFPSLQQISRGMGVMLAKMHWSVGITGRDAELVLSGDGAEGVRCYIFDFNQCSRWLLPDALKNATSTPVSLSMLEFTTGDFAGQSILVGAERLAKMICGQEFYYPRPHQTELYIPFREGYLTSVRTILGECEVDDSSTLLDHRTLMVETVNAAAEHFFKVFEAENEARLSRKARLRARGGSLGERAHD